VRGHEGRLWWWWWPVSAAVAIACAFLALAAADAQRDGRDDQAAREGSDAVAAAAVDLAGRAASTLERLDLEGGSIAALPVLAERGAPAGATAVAVVEARDGAAELVVATGAIDPSVLAAREVAVAVGTARDDGLATLAAPVPDGGAVVLAVPIYEVGGVPTTELPAASTGQRRAAWTGAVLLQLDVAALLGEADRAARVSDGVVVLAAVGDPLGEETAGLVVPIGARQWLVEVPAGTSGVPAAAVLALVVGAMAAAGVLALTRSVELGARRAGTRADARARQSGTIHRVATVLQQSPDLGDVLPAFAVLLQEELGVDGFALATFRADGHEQEIFASGRAVEAGAVAAVEVDSLEAGATLVLPLRRAERDIARLRLRSSRRLGSLDLESIRSSAELLAAALISAQAFERQEGAMEALRQVDELKNVFLGVASHELRTPVTAIGGFARLLADRWDQLPEDQRRNLASRIEANAAALGVLVQDLLDFSRLERGRFIVDSEEVDLATRLEAVVDRLGPIWGDREVRLAIDDRPTVIGDGDALERVAANLLSNAAKFSPEGSVIVAGIAVEGGEVVLRVDDAGPGVPEEDRDRIYAAFFRGKGDAVVRTRGAGIGLSVVKEIIEQMGGTISVATSPAGGARFEVRLPLERAAPVPEQEVVG
jgi:signal transduction histidine kinase